MASDDRRELLQALSHGPMHLKETIRLCSTQNFFYSQVFNWTLYSFESIGRNSFFELRNRKKQAN